MVTGPSIGRITVLAGHPFSGSGISGNNGPALAASLAHPERVSLESSGNVLVADNVVGAKPSDVGCQVREITLPQGVIRAVAGTGMPGYSGDGGPASSARLGACGGIAVDANGDIFVTDEIAGTVRVINAEGRTIQTVAGGGNALGDNGPAREAILNNPSGLVVDEHGNLFIADTGQNRIRKVAGSGTISTVAGTGEAGYFGDGAISTSAQLNAPLGVAVDLSGNLLIADTGNHVVRRVNLSSGVIDTLVGTGKSGSAGDGGAARTAELSNPWDVVVDTRGNIFIADQVVREVMANSGIIRTVAGNGKTPSTNAEWQAQATPLPALDAEIDAQGLAIEPDGNLIIADTANRLIRHLVFEER
jgi:sugar lactone lactonase YvrE